MSIEVTLPYAAPNAGFLAELQREAAHKGKECVVSGLIVDPKGRIFVHRRSKERALFPGCWDIAGGHVDPGETLLGALAREIKEETGWDLADAVELLQIYDWQTVNQGKVQHRREFDFIVTVRGKLTAPCLEKSKHTEYRWAAPGAIEFLLEHRSPDDTFIHDLVKAAHNRLAHLPMP